MQHFLIRDIPKVHLFKGNFSFYFRLLLGSGIGYMAIGIQNIKDPSRGHHSHLQGIEFIRDMTQWSKEHSGKENKSKNDSKIRLWNWQ